MLLTSANLSKAAWGKLNKAKNKLHIMSYEAGVLLLPKFVLETEQGNSQLIFLIGFPITDTYQISVSKVLYSTAERLLKTSVLFIYRSLQFESRQAHLAI